jgi:hypothetical protein
MKGCLFFHNWSKWEQYIESGTMVLTGLLVNQESRGKQVSFSEKRQRRSCGKCGKVQDVLISGV